MHKSIIMTAQVLSWGLPLSLVYLCLSFRHENGLSLFEWPFLFLSADEVKNLWLEYENNASLEANLVKDFDKVKSLNFLRQV